MVTPEAIAARQTPQAENETGEAPDLRTLEGARAFLCYHSPSPAESIAHSRVNLAFQDLLAVLWPEVPAGPGKTILIRDLNRARMAANSAIANHGS